MTSKTVYAAKLGVFGAELDPDVLTRRTGLTPSAAFRVGDLKPNGRRHDVAAWRIRSADHPDRMEALAELWARVDPVWPELVALAREHTAYVEVVIVAAEDVSPDERFDLNFEVDVVRRAAELGASLGFDLYDYRERPPAPTE